MSGESSSPVPERESFLICGLGSLGQYCILKLKQLLPNLEVAKIVAIDLVPPTIWESEEIPQCLNSVITGDCRQEGTLKQAGIAACRSVLIVTNDESTNIETAIAVRRLNPTACLVVRSARQNLNQLLRQQLGHFIALEPATITANTFALAALGEGTLGCFRIKEDWFRVVGQQVQPQDPRFDRVSASKLHKKNYRLLQWLGTTPATTDAEAPLYAEAPFYAEDTFYQWPVDAQLQPGETIIYIEQLERVGTHPTRQANRGAGLLNWRVVRDGWRWLRDGGWQRQWREFWVWLQEERTRQLVAAGVILAVGLWGLGALVLRLNVPGIRWQQAFSSSFILLLGGYGDVFGGLAPEPVPGWVMLVCLLITAISLLFILGILGLIADNLLSARFEFWRQRQAMPKQAHIVLVGLGRTGRQIAELLLQFRQPVLVLTEQGDNLDPSLPLPALVGKIPRLLARTHLESARSLITATDDQMLNLELALTAQSLPRTSAQPLGLVIRTANQRFSDNLNELLPLAQSFCTDALAAEAFAAAAFGENILGLFRLGRQTILVTEFLIQPGDTLNGRILSQVAYGYNIVPIIHERLHATFGTQATASYLPPDDLRLHPGDRLVVLASIDRLRQIERGDVIPAKRWRLQAGKPLNPAFMLEFSNDLAKISGCDLQTARLFVQNLPGTLELELYDHQAFRLSQELGRQLPIQLDLLPGTELSNREPSP